MNRDEWRVAHAHELLTEADVAELPDGTVVELIWSGGNGPHRYRVHQHEGTTYAVPPRDFSPESWLWFYNPITFIGSESFHTQIIVSVEES